MAGSDSEPPPLVRELEDAVRGLHFSSESDRPMEAFHLRIPADAVVTERLTAGAFARLVGAPADAPVATESLDSFLARHIELVEPLDRVAWALMPRYRSLKKLLLDRLSDVRVYRIGRIEIQCYAVGRDDAGDIAGIRTVAVET